jgi:hypothetical protein
LTWYASYRIVMGAVPLCGSECVIEVSLLIGISGDENSGGEFCRRRRDISSAMVSVLASGLSLSRRWSRMRRCARYLSQNLILWAVIVMGDLVTWLFCVLVVGQNFIQGGGIRNLSVLSWICGKDVESGMQ